jgi:hypothetical protein
VQPDHGSMWSYRLDELRRISLLVLQCHLCELWDILYPFDGRGGR